MCKSLLTYCLSLQQIAAFPEYVCGYVCTHGSLYVRMWVCMYARGYVCTHVGLYVRMWVCMYACLYVHVASVRVRVRESTCACVLTF